ncbi:hypothetical protein [Candidatus Uabimicrobium sp. HlEnr_7]|uniref:hypothetical protein n=1 Tax=Candidatus Uabimicrobium helgolandensis TaxID=3095367 RepID=UPI003558C26B
MERKWIVTILENCKALASGDSSKYYECVWQILTSSREELEEILQQLLEISLSNLPNCLKALVSHRYMLILPDGDFYSLAKDILDKYLVKPQDKSLIEICNELSKSDMGFAEEFEACAFYIITASFEELEHIVSIVYDTFFNELSVPVLSFIGQRCALIGGDDDYVDHATALITMHCSPGEDDNAILGVFD